MIKSDGSGAEFLYGSVPRMKHHNASQVYEIPTPLRKNGSSYSILYPFAKIKSIYYDVPQKNDSNIVFDEKVCYHQLMGDSEHCMKISRSEPINSELRELATSIMIKMNAIESSVKEQTEPADNGTESDEASSEVQSSMESFINQMLFTNDKNPMRNIVVSVLSVS